MITLRKLLPQEADWFCRLEGDYHYMGEFHSGECEADIVRLVFEEEGQAVALMTWASACYNLKVRDLHIGWNATMRASRRKLVVNIRKYTELNRAGTPLGLFPQLIEMAMAELPAIWERQWGYKPLLAEAFCDFQDPVAARYDAAGWEQAGIAKVFQSGSHARKNYIPNGKPKFVFLKPFHRDAWGILVSNTLPSEYEVAVHTRADAVLPFPPSQVESLRRELGKARDPRGRNNSIGLGPLLTIFTLAMATGAKDLKEAYAFVKRLSNAQLKELGCPKKKDIYGAVIENEYLCPSYTALYRLFRHKDKAGRYNFDVADFASHLALWIAAERAMLPSRLVADDGFIDGIVRFLTVADAKATVERGNEEINPGGEEVARVERCCSSF